MLKRLFEADKKLILKFCVSLFLTILFTFVAVELRAYAASQVDAENTSVTAESSDEEGAATPGDYVGDSETNVGSSPTASVLQELIGVDASQPLEVIILLTIIALLPSLLMMVTCFARIVIVLGFLRSAMQTQNTPPNTVITGLALFLTLFIMAPVFTEMNDIAYQPYVNEELTLEEAIDAASVPLKRFMLKQTSNDDLEFFVELSNTEVPAEITDEYKETELPLTTIIPAFMIGELKRAFQMGFMIFLPFLVIDIVVGSTLMSMGMMMLPPAMISMPFKILVFVLADGWNLMIGSIVASYNW
ncbi:MAG: flagellar type III secretion system pore protein FliP [Oscillospiraceae bacterium]|nr:flagellar type III secretion system pore protein FliP [Oscillospiraceae bacterium]MCH5207883.1 flagellar type III secretion system pore protein FliP [Oscillospiraceae bacterium]